MTVLQLQGSDLDCFWHLGLLLLSVSLTIFPFPSSSCFLLFSLFDSSWNTFISKHSQTHTHIHAVARNHIKPFSAAFKEDSWAHFKPKVLISYNRLLCGSWGGSWYFCLNRPLLEGLVVLISWQTLKQQTTNTTRLKFGDFCSTVSSNNWIWWLWKRKNRQTTNNKNQPLILTAQQDFQESTLWLLYLQLFLNTYVYTFPPCNAVYKHSMHHISQL